MYTFYQQGITLPTAYRTHVEYVELTILVDSKLYSRLQLLVAVWLLCNVLFYYLVYCRQNNFNIGDNDDDNGDDDHHHHDDDNYYF